MAVIHVIQNEAGPVIRELLAAADQLGLPASVVATSSDGIYGFSLIVPDLVYERAYGHPQELDFLRHAAPKGPDENSEPVDEPTPVPKKKGGRPRKAAAEPVEDEE